MMKPLSRSIKNVPLWGFDIETEGEMNNFVCASIIGDYGINFWTKDKNEFIRYLIKNIHFIRFNGVKRQGFYSGYIVATNLGFDIMGLFEESKYFDMFNPMIRASNMIGAFFTYKKRKIKFIDTMSFIKMGVEAWGKYLKISKLNHPSCFGKIPKNIDEWNELKIYNIRDSYITYKATKFLQDGFNDLGSNLKVTVSSTAMDLYRRVYFKGVWYKPKKANIEYLHNGYYGGRTEIFKRGFIENVNYYDFNSLYPSVMQGIYPDPNSRKYSSCIKESTIMQYEGLAKVTVKAPKMYIPYLPHKLNTKDSIKLVFPTGKWTGYYTFFEIRKALSLGYKIIKYHNAYIYFRNCSPFKDYVDKLYGLRMYYKSINDPREIIIKLMLNSLYGKFAQKTDYREFILHESKVTLEMIEESLTTKRSNEFFILRKPYKKIPYFVNPILSIYTTAYARDKLFNVLNNNVLYCDTDSIFTPSEMDFSKDLGDLKLEFKINNGILVKPKMYIIDEVVKCKGVSRCDVNIFNKLLNSDKIFIRKFAKFKECGVRGFKYNQVIHKAFSVDLEDNKRKWSGKFNPRILQESKPLKI